MPTSPSIPAVERKLLVNEQAASERIAQFEDPVLRHVLELALDAAIGRCRRPEGMSDDEYRARLPREPFDLAFYAELLETIFAPRERLLRVLHGTNLDDWMSPP